MESAKIESLLEQLDGDIDDLEDSLAPIIESTLSATSSKLPLLDKAKLYVLVTYAIESVLFSYLRLDGIKARDHPVFTELTRVRQYFDKIKTAEASPDERPTISLDKRTAARFIKAGLSGNDKYDSTRTRRQGLEMIPSHTKFEDLPKVSEHVTNIPSVAIDTSSSSNAAVETTREGSSKVMNAPKKRKSDAVDESGPISTLRCTDSGLELLHGKGKKNKEDRKKRKKNKSITNDEGKES